MPALIGFNLAVVVTILARITGFDRDRAFYPIVLMMIASYYVLFAVMGGSEADLATETPVFAIFAVAVISGFRTNLWIVVAAFAMHGVFDFIHHSLLAAHGVPGWWPTFCLAYDLSAAACLASLLLIKRMRAQILLSYTPQRCGDYALDIPRAET